MGEGRKLAAILVSDVVGFSRMTGEDEEGTLERLRALRSEFVDPSVAAHDGRIVKSTGDGVIAEYRSVVEAARSAIEIQNGLAERNSGFTVDAPLVLRIGVHLGDVVEEADVHQAGDQKKHLSNVIELVAYQAESELARLVTPHYRRAQLEGRTLVQIALASAADIKVTDSELLVTLVPLSSAHRSRVIAALCAKLNATATVFPGTRLRLRYAVAGPP